MPKRAQSKAATADKTSEKISSTAGKRGRGRPRKPDAEALSSRTTKPVGVRLTAAQRARLREASRISGERLGEILRLGGLERAEGIIRGETAGN